MTQTARLGKLVLLLAIIVGLFPASTFAADTTVASIKFSDSTTLDLSIDSGETELTLYAIQSDGTKTDITTTATWATSSSTIVEVSQGVIKPLAAGTVTITAKYSGFTTTRKVVVTSPYTKLALSPSSDKITNVNIDEPYTFTAKATKKDGTVVDVSDLATWSTYDTKIATVDDGKVDGVAQGSTTLTVSYLGLTDSTTIYVRTSFDGLNLTPETDQVMFVGQKSAAIKAEVIDSDNTTDVTSKTTWTSSTPLNVTVDSGVLQAWTAGTATITAKYQGFTKSFDVTVYKKMKKIEASVESIDLTPDQTLTLPTVKGTALDGTTTDLSKAMTWEVDSNIATLTSTSIVGENIGTASLVGTVGNLKVTIPVTVASSYSDLSLSIGSELNLNIGDSQQITVTATQEDGTTADVTDLDTVTWSTYDSKIIKVVDGKVTGLSAGKTTLTVKYKTLTTTATLYVRSSFQGLILTPEDDQVMFIGQTPTQIKAELANATDVKDITSDVTWTSSAPLVATVDKGVLTPWVEGTSTIKAQYEDFTKSFKVTVYKTMKKLEPDVTSIDLVTGKSVTLPKVTGTAVDGTTTDLSKVVDWTVDGSAASLTSTKITGETAGNVNLVGTVGNMQVTVPVTVKTKILNLTPSATSLSVVVGATAAIPTVQAVAADGTTSDVSDDIVWTSSSNKLLVQGDNVKALVKGTASLKGTYLNETVRVSVKMEGKLASIVVTPTDIDLAINKSKSIKVTGKYTDGKSVTLSTKMNWVSSNTSVATVKGSSVKAIGMGTTTLTGSYQGLTATVKVTVSAQLKKLTLSEKSLKMTTGTTTILLVTAEYDTGETVDVSQNATWTSSKTNVATVSNGKISAVAKGTSAIRVEFDGKRVSTNVTVKDAASK
ncbi:Ig domain-containing protein [Paenibacillus sp. WLX1005]|uniref:Ig-like domain-containing protein n=1 Tax=Paenibacillus sp. WLX1005 TaxID=3243766 RepID=UPI0039844AC4